VCAFLIFSLIYLDLTVGFISFFALAITAVVIKAAKRLDSRRVEKFVVLGAASIAALATASLLIRSLAGTLGDALGEPTSLRARFDIWDSVLESLGVSGLIFGHGTAFWARDSPFAAVVHETLQSSGLGAFGHAHRASGIVNARCQKQHPVGRKLHLAGRNLESGAPNSKRKRNNF